MRIKKAGILIIAAAITCTTPAVPAMAADTSESVQEIISDNEIDSLVSDPDKVVDIIMYVKNEAAKQDISDDQIRSLIQTAAEIGSSTFNSFDLSVSFHIQCSGRIVVISLNRSRILILMRNSSGVL